MHFISPLAAIHRIPLPISAAIVLLFLFLSEVGVMASGHSAEKSDSAVAPFWPLGDEKILTSNFGEWRGDRFHTGIDFRTRRKTGLAVHSPWDGEVIRLSAQWRGYGRALYIRHPNGVISVFGHLQVFRSDLEELLTIKRRETGRKWGHDINLQEGAFVVSRGETIAWSGETGVGFPHLHFETRKGMSNPFPPWESGFVTPDRITPEIISLCFIPLSADTRFNGKTGTHQVKFETRKASTSAKATTKATARSRTGAKTGEQIDQSTMPVRIQGPFALEAVILDRGDGAVNKMTPWKMELELDGKVIFSRTKGMLSFGENHKGGTVYDLRRPGFTSGGLTEFLFHLPEGIWKPVNPKKAANSSKNAGNFKTALFRGRWNASAGDGTIWPENLGWGSHVIRVRAYDSAGNFAERDLNLILNSSPDIRVSESEKMRNGTGKNPENRSLALRVHDPDIMNISQSGRLISSADLIDKIIVESHDSNGWKRDAVVSLANANTSLVLPAVSAKPVRIACADAAGATSEWAFVPAGEPDKRGLAELPEGRTKLSREGFVLEVLYKSGPEPEILKSSPKVILVSGSKGCSKLFMEFCEKSGRKKFDGITARKGIVNIGSEEIEDRAHGVWPMTLTDDGHWICAGDIGIVPGPNLEILIWLEDQGILLHPSGNSLRVTPLTGKYPVYMESDDNLMKIFMSREGVYFTALGGIETGPVAKGWKLDSLGKLYRPEPWGVTLRKPCKITFLLPAGLRGNSAQQAGIYSRVRGKDNWSYAGGKVSKGTISVSARHLNREYAIFADKVPPVVIKLRFKNGKERVVAFSVSDIGEGVDPAAIEIMAGGVRIPADYDPDRASVESQNLDLKAFPKGSKVRVRVCDRAGNWSIIHTVNLK
ncbi:MAG: hypothetical protein CVV64_09215 [Candidatus Wallbacteria bacterium HGW-Wallbacteria-1]|jgi:murein DD-endopeptidase MepM/ murein hydrolase activator NlpD|uniref:M23ase beta-sheet core domain-containing protein n=1 Tax=Candidatus Wallbacteria bacterium HGW-Wallbacteria-1 TaxID=2013854 RepID=A0A2N1PQB4_9BACT|nr:MAG: hypothetical protein CVV64_09215 [Candidatus Wallbacteria bacterium HGW-Wallbacteria-1]